MNQTNRHSDFRETDDFPGYPVYPADEDIFSNFQEEEQLNPENIAKSKVPYCNSKSGTRHEKHFSDDLNVSDLDIPSSELDDQQEDIGSEDEENNYYSIGGDDHTNMEEDMGK